MKYFNWRRKLLLLYISKALVVLSARSTSNKNIGLPGFCRAGGGVRNSSWKIPPAGVLGRRKDQEESRPDDDYKANVFPKKEKEIIYIQEALKTNILFQDLSQVEDNQHLLDIVASFEKHIYNKGDFLCQQGEKENADYMYLIASGRCSVSIDGKILPNPYGRVGPGSIVGDLALLYRTARAATIRTETIVEVYRLHRKDFDYFMNHAAIKGDDTSSRAETIKRQLSEIDSIIDRISGVKTKYEGDVIQQFKPSRLWLWTRWRGTIMQHAWKAAVGNMLISLFSRSL